MNTYKEDYKIQEMNLNRYDELITFWKSIDGLFIRDDDNRDRLELFLRRNPGLNFVVLHNDKIIATIKASHDGRRGYLHHLAVNPEYRRKGIANDLVKMCLKKLRKEGIRNFRAFVLNTNTTAIEFWKQEGFSAQDYNYKTMEINE